jgi:hypothetical protein
MQRQIRSLVKSNSRVCSGEQDFIKVKNTSFSGIMFLVLTIASCGQSSTSESSAEAQSPKQEEKKTIKAQEIEPASTMRLSYPLGDSAITPETTCAETSNTCINPVKK